MRRGLIVLIATLTLGQPVAAAGDGCGEPRDPARRVAAVPADFVLALDDGAEVRLAGVVWPRPGGSEEARRALASLAVGRSVRLAGATTDRHGRVAARAVRDDGLDLSAALAGAGLALAAGAPRLTACERVILAAEAAARQARRGGWGDGRLAVDTADDPALADGAGRFAVVEGRVWSVGRSGRIHYLNFGRRWRLDFTVTIAESDAQVLASRGLAPAVLPGELIRVRGWLDAREGGFLRLAGPEEIERVGGVAPAGEGG